MTPDENQSQQLHQTSHPALAANAATPCGSTSISGGTTGGHSFLHSTSGGQTIAAVVPDPNSALSTAGVTTTDG